MVMQITPEATAAFPLSAEPATTGKDWRSAVPDALAFVLGLAVARWAGWTAGDLVWSLWLSSLVVGYTTILWMIGQPAVTMAMGVWRSTRDPLSSLRIVFLLWGLILLVAALILAFFTVHFGGFHYVHSQILLHFFPISAPGPGSQTLAGRSVYLEIFRRYWIFLPSAFLTHRAAFKRNPFVIEGAGWRDSIAGGKGRDVFAEPYRNVLRMHALIFFFFAAHFAGLENFAVYSVISAVYFFPWRLVR
jgi:hypothetical protein